MMISKYNIHNKRTILTTWRNSMNRFNYSYPLMNLWDSTPLFTLDKPPFTIKHVWLSTYSPTHPVLSACIYSLVVDSLLSLLDKTMWITKRVIVYQFVPPMWYILIHHAAIKLVSAHSLFDISCAFQSYHIWKYTTGQFRAPNISSCINTDENMHSVLLPYTNQLIHCMLSKHCGRKCDICH